MQKTENCYQHSQHFWKLSEKYSLKINYWDFSDWSQEFTRTVYLTHGSLFLSWRKSILKSIDVDYDGRSDATQLGPQHQYHTINSVLGLTVSWCELWWWWWCIIVVMVLGFTQSPSSHLLYLLRFYDHIWPLLIWTIHYFSPAWQHYFSSC